MRIPGIMTTLAHFIFGLLSCLSVIVNPALTVLGVALFIIYEMDEEWRLSDPAYEEIRQFSAGFATGMILLILGKLLLWLLKLPIP